MTEEKRSILFGMQVLVNHDWVKHHAVIVEAGKIKAIIPDDMIKHHLPAKKHEYPEDHFLVPGFIDLHVHGANGHDVMDADLPGLMAMRRALLKEGVTGFLATTMSAENNKIEAALATVAASMSHAEGAAILGVHLEGPFIAKDKMGAQRMSGAECDEALIRRWQKIAKGAIKMVTLAPELPGAIPLIEALCKMDIKVSIGHTNATYAETCAGIDAGCTHATHLFNAMRGIHQREPGAAGALLLANEVTAELIVDRLHLHPAIVELALRVKGRDRLVLVTDAMRAKCMGDGQYDLGGQQVSVVAGKAMLADGTLAGSTLRMPEAIKNFAEFTNCSLPDAIYMASLNPARTLDISYERGSIEVGKAADLVVLNAALDVVFTLQS